MLSLTLRFTHIVTKLTFLLDQCHFPQTSFSPYLSIRPLRLWPPHTPTCLSGLGPESHHQLPLLFKSADSRSWDLLGHQNWGNWFLSWISSYIYLIYLPILLVLFLWWTLTNTTTFIYLQLSCLLPSLSKFTAASTASFSSLPHPQHTAQKHVKMEASINENWFKASQLRFDPVSLFVICLTLKCMCKRTIHCTGKKNSWKQQLWNNYSPT